MSSAEKYRIGTEEIIGFEELESALKSGRPLNIKLGIDPTSRELHLGHAVVLQKLRQFQDDGHQTYLIIGDFTGSIGDPAGVNKTRPVLTDAEIRENMQTYFQQAGKILDLEKTHVVYNSEWLKTMNLGQLIGYAMQITVNNLIEREDFSKRLEANQSVGLHEFMYPLVMAIDSVHLKADVEIGGVDQRLNLLMGRELQKKLGQKPQTAIAMKLLVGLDGKEKMSSSKGNFVGIDEPANQMFGKLMRVPDELIDEYAASQMLSAPAGDHPRERKAAMAKAIVALYHGDEAARAAEATFNQTFRDKEVTPDLVEAVDVDEKEMLLKRAVAVATGESISWAERTIEQNGVKVNNETVSEPNQSLVLDRPIHLQVGKHRFFELRLK